MPRVGLEPLSDRQREVLRALVDRGDSGITVREIVSSRLPMRATLRAFERRGLAGYTCDRKPNGTPVFGTWRYVANSAGVIEAMRSAAVAP